MRDYANKAEGEVNRLESAFIGFPARRIRFIAAEKPAQWRRAHP